MQNYTPIVIFLKGPRNPIPLTVSYKGHSQEKYKLHVNTYNCQSLVNGFASFCNFSYLISL